MKLGFLTACFAGESLEKVRGWAKENGFQALEVACWPVANAAAFHAKHIDVAALGQEEADEIRAAFDADGLQISALAFYENNLHGDPTTRAGINEHLKACIRAAKMLGVPYVGTFIGRNMALPVKENIELGNRILPGLVEYASDHGVELVIENCPMEGWGPDGYPANLAYTPELWDWIIDLGFKLNFDPSHLMWLGIDPVAAAAEYGEHIRHMQAKDVEINDLHRQRYSIFGKTISRVDGWDTGWWRYRMPGLGQVPWGRLIDVLYQVGYEGVISIEHEDPVWSGTPEKTLDGLRIAKRELASHMVPARD